MYVIIYNHNFQKERMGGVAKAPLQAEGASGPSVPGPRGNPAARTCVLRFVGGGWPKMILELQNLVIGLCLKASKRFLKSFY